MSPIKIPKEKKWSGELAKESCDFNVLYIVIRWQIDGTYGVVSLEKESDCYNLKWRLDHILGMWDIMADKDGCTTMMASDRIIR